MLDTGARLAPYGFILLWSSAFSVAKLAMADCPPLLMLTARFLLAGLLMLGVAAVAGTSLKLDRRDLAIFAMLGMANQAVYLGLGYVGAMVAVNVTTLGLYRLNGQFGPFHALALLSLAVVTMGVLAVLRRRPNWLARHYQSMAYSYLGLCAAAVAEVAVRLELFGSLVNGARGIIILGVAIAVLFAAFGYLVIDTLAEVVHRDNRHARL